MKPKKNNFFDVEQVYSPKPGLSISDLEKQIEDVWFNYKPDPRDRHLHLYTNQAGIDLWENMITEKFLKDTFFVNNPHLKGLNNSEEVYQYYKDNDLLIKR